MDNIINSEEYWNTRFESGDWEKNGGNKQTIYFYKLLYKLLPGYLQKDFNNIENSYSIADIGCAEGDGTQVLSEKFFNASLTGIDIAIKAIIKAKELYPNILFTNKLNQKYDVIISSNVLEHFENPFEHLNELFDASNKYVVLLVPFEEITRIEEHFYTFLYKDFKLKFSNFNLIYMKGVYSDKNIWDGKQHLFVYQKNIDTDLISLDKFGISDMLNEKEQLLEDEKDKILEYKKLLLLKEEELLLSKEDHQRTKEELLVSKEDHQRTKDELLAREEELQMIKKDRDEYQNQLQEKENEIQRLNGQLHQLNHELHMIKQSRSWKMVSKYYQTINNNKLISDVHHKVKEIKKYLFSKDTNKIKDHDKDLKKILKKHKNKKIFIFPILVDWNIPLFQRPQHLAMNTAKQNVLYFFCTSNGQYDEIDGFEEVTPGCYITNQYDLVDQIQGRNKIYDISSTDNGTDWTFVQTRLDRGDTIVYQYIDEISAEISGREIPESLFEKHFNILKDERCIVIPSATKLENDVKEYRNTNYKLVTNGVEIKHFSQKISYDMYPDKIKDLANKKKPVIGYFGAFAVWFDYELVIKLATERPEYEILLLGVNYDGSIDKYNFHEYDNVTIMGPIDYKELPKYAAVFSVSTIPFLINDITESTSPIKLFEYMAMQRPIVTTNMPECRKYESVLIGKTHDEYIKKVDEALKLSNDEKYIALLKKEALDNSWETKAQDIVELVNA